ncbi:hypothetical protein VTJ83DRAFT_5499 [Remersonia thermophila]|uniref:Phosphotransferase n=1 Tax=Remersonia thermophila TaxID=72144 RepID=A0ABR4D977_9PEZI
MPPQAPLKSLQAVLAAVLRYLMRGRSLLRSWLAFRPSEPVSAVWSQDGPSTKHGTDPIADFLAEAEHLLLGHIQGGGLRQLSQKLKSQFRERLRSNPECMLPSYISRLPAGRESGRFLALDVGGSTLRVALVELIGSGPTAPESRVIRMDSFKIDHHVRNLRGEAFFDWMAERIRQALSEDDAREHDPEHPLLVGLAWSFPIEQTSSRGGKLGAMGKGFLANEGLVGEDLGGIIQTACRKQGVHVELAAIVNDSSAALLSEAYGDPSTRFSLILGTGVNMAAHLPVAAIAAPKFGTRPDSWYEQASHVIVDTELGMFGHGILPLARWDKLLKDAHPRPELQPLEYLVSGYYLGEVCRLVLLEAIPGTGVFGGVVPPSLMTPYALDTETLGIIEGDTTPTLTAALATFTARHPFPSYTPTVADMRFLRTLASLIARRSASLIAASVAALWELKADAERSLIADLGSSTSTSSQSSPDARLVAAAQEELNLTRRGTTTVAFNGSVVENYPGYRAWLQDFVDELVSEAEAEAAAGAVPPAEKEIDGARDKDEDSGKRRKRIKLVEARESSLRGAAVALASLG